MDFDALNHIEAPGRYASSVTVNGVQFVSLEEATRLTGRPRELILWLCVSQRLPEHFIADGIMYVNLGQLRRVTLGMPWDSIATDRFGNGIPNH